MKIAATTAQNNLELLYKNMDRMSKADVANFDKLRYHAKDKAECAVGHAFSLILGDGEDRWLYWEAPKFLYLIAAFATLPVYGTSLGVAKVIDAVRNGVNTSRIATLAGKYK